MLSSGLARQVQRLLMPTASAPTRWSTSRRTPSALPVGFAPSIVADGNALRIVLGDRHAALATKVLATVTVTNSDAPCSGSGAVLRSRLYLRVRRRFSGLDWCRAPQRSCLSFVLMLATPVRPRRMRFACFPSFVEQVTQRGDVCSCRANVTAHRGNV